MSYIPPAIPRYLFGILEPLMMVGGISIFLDPQSFVDSQIPLSPSVPLTPANKLVTLQLANVGLFIGGVAATIIFRSTARTIRTYLQLQCAADVAHVMITYSVMGKALFFNVGAWNGMTWVNFVASPTLCLLRVFTLAGWFGRIEESVKEE